MDSSIMNHMFLNVFENFESLTKNPELFLQPAPDENQGFKNVTKNIHDLIFPSNSLTALKTKSLPKLLINGFDDEQVWQQIELQNKNAVSHLENVSSKIDTGNLYLGVNILEDEKKNEVDHFSGASSVDDGESNESSSEDSDEYVDVDDLSQKRKLKETASSDSFQKLRKRTFKNKVDDKFFKISELEQFLRLEDLKEERSWDADKKEDLSEEDDDLFQDISDEGSGDELYIENSQKKDIMYEDFFDAPESEDESITGSKGVSDDEEDTNLHFDKEGEALLSDAENLEEEAGSLAKDPKNELVSSKDPKDKTRFQLQVERTEEQIAKFEKGLLEPTQWHLSGEVDSSKRPTDGLLDIHTDFEMNARSAVLEDKPLCEKLENIVKMAAKNKLYSDGVKQFKTSNEIIAQKKEVLDQNKSKKSLAEEYQDIYQKKQSKQGEEEDPKHKEIKKKMDDLFAELHALFSHTPKPAVPDIRIVSNLPAISVEEVAPTSVSDVTLLAPEEVKKRSGLVKGVTERIDVDRKRERRKKKALQKLIQKKKEKESSEKPISGKLKKKERLEELKKLKQHRNTKIANVNGEKIKSSKDFFAHLQETVHKTGKLQGTHLKKKKN